MKILDWLKDLIFPVIREKETPENFADCPPIIFRVGVIEFADNVNATNLSEKTSWRLKAAQSSTWLTKGRTLLTRPKPMSSSGAIAKATKSAWTSKPTNNMNMKTNPLFPCWTVFISLPFQKQMPPFSLRLCWTWYTEPLSAPSRLRTRKPESTAAICWKKSSMNWP